MVKIVSKETLITILWQETIEKLNVIRNKE